MANDNTGCRRYDPADDTTDVGMKVTVALAEDLAEARRLIAELLGYVSDVADQFAPIRGRVYTFLDRTLPPKRTREEVWRERCADFDKATGRGDR